MGANQSYISNSHYGYDFVVAITQESINAAMRKYLSDTAFPTIQMYWNLDNNGNPVAVSREELLQQTNGTDPLKVPSWKAGELMTPDMKNIAGSRFLFAFEAAIGVPFGIDPAHNPDIVMLQVSRQWVVFTLICSEFTVVTSNFGPQGLESFENVSQTANEPWLFTCLVALREFLNNSDLPPAVQQQLNNLGPNAYSVQQLHFDFDNAALGATPTISGIQPGTPAYTLLEQFFMGAYFTAMRTAAQPVLNYSILEHSGVANPESTFTLTNMALEVSPYYTPIGQFPNSDLKTLNHLCEANGSSLPPPAVFNWNWIEASEETQFDGVVSINRNTLARYFQNQLTGYISRNCLKTFVRVWLTGFFDQNVNYSWFFTPNQAPTIATPATGADVLTYNYASFYSDDAGVGGDMGAMNLGTNLTATVAFSGDTIVITQTLVVSVYIRAEQSSESWNQVNKTITDTYTLGVGPNGELTSSRNSVLTDNSDPTPNSGWFLSAFTGLNDLLGDIANATQGFAATDFQSIPINVAQEFVFPGGKTITFKDVGFSDNQDLIAHISRES